MNNKKNKYNTLHYLIALLEAYGIKDVVASPGTQNARFNSIVQENVNFRCFSVVDERSAGYVATGIAHETEKPVVITCTGATASRNYLSAMTEAYYRKIPIIAITFYACTTNSCSLSPHYIDRSVTQNDVKYISIDLPMINTPVDAQNCILMLNTALSAAVYKKQSVHINCPANNDFKTDFNTFPNIWKTEYYKEDFDYLKDCFKEKKVAVFIGSHDKFSKKEENSISDFAKSWDIPVFCDHISNYHGANKILVSQAVNMVRLKKEYPNLIIDIGNVSGEYNCELLFRNATIWRVSADGLLKCRSGRPVIKTFFCLENVFFERLINSEIVKNGYYSVLKAKVEKIKIPELPLCYALVCKNLANYMPKNCSLHLSILNSLRNMNFFNLDPTIDVNCNVGGFGIDGPVSTLIGQSLGNPNKKHFGLIGDLAFFYDMNILGNRNIKNNVRILVLNNNRGVEFRLNPAIENYFADKTDILIASGGHNTNGVKCWAEACNFSYIYADNKKDFVEQINEFCNGEFDKPVLFEVITNVKDEQDGLKLMRTFNRNRIEEGIIDCYRHLKNIGK